MTNVYKIPLRNILYLCKLIGITYSHILESDRLSIQNTDIILYKCLEFTIMIMLLISMYFLYTNTFFLHIIYLL